MLSIRLNSLIHMNQCMALRRAVDVVATEDCALHLTIVSGAIGRAAIQKYRSVAIDDGCRLGGALSATIDIALDGAAG